MVGKVDLRMTGGQALEAALRDLGGKVAGRLGANAVRAGAREIVKDAKRRVPVLSGDLKRSIRVFSRTRRRGAEVAADLGTDVFYGRFLEFGTAHQSAQPWLRPAIDEGAQRALDKMLDNLAKGIARETAKHRNR